MLPSTTSRARANMTLATTSSPVPSARRRPSTSSTTPPARQRGLTCLLSRLRPRAATGPLPRRCTSSSPSNCGTRAYRRTLSWASSTRHGPSYFQSYWAGCSVSLNGRGSSQLMSRMRPVWNAAQKIATRPRRRSPSPPLLVPSTGQEATRTKPRHLPTTPWSMRGAARSAPPTVRSAKLPPLSAKLPAQSAKQSARKPT